MEEINRNLLELMIAQITDGILFKRYSQFKNNGTATFIIGQIPDAFTQDSIYNCPNLVLSAPNGIEINHSILIAVPH